MNFFLTSLVPFLFCSLISQTFAQDSTTSWAHESEFGLTSTKSAQASSNDTDIYYAKHKTNLTSGKKNITAQGNYYYGKQGNELTARSWMTSLKWDRSLSEKFSIFVAETLEGNRFMGYVLRSSTDLGGKYFFMTKEDAKDLDYFFVEAGYRLSYDDLTNNPNNVNSTSNQARAYTEYSKAWNAVFSTKLWIEYIKTLGNDNRNMYNSELSALAKMSDILTMKAAYLVKFDDSLKDKNFERNTDRTILVALIANY